MYILKRNLENFHEKLQQCKLLGQRTQSSKEQIFKFQK